MSNHSASIHWSRDDQLFTDNKYSREHTWIFDGGSKIAASSSPLVVPIPFSNPANVDPEEAFVASLASCHMLWFLSIAAKRGLQIDRYDDDAIGKMGRASDGKLSMVSVELRPKVSFANGRDPERTVVESMHKEAHQECFLARSVNFPVRITPLW